MRVQSRLVSPSMSTYVKCCWNACYLKAATFPQESSTVVNLSTLMKYISAVTWCN